MRHTLFFVFVGFFVLASLAGCGNRAVAPRVDCAGVHFCLSAFLQAELAEYNAAQPHLQKYAYLNGKEENQTIQLDETRWNVEFTAFREADIDKPALNGKYKVDTLYIETDSMTHVSYIAKDDDLRTRYIHLYFKPNNPRPSYIEARVATKNVFYRSVQDLIFSPGEYYSISGYQNIWLLGEDSFAVKSVFVGEVE